MKHQKVKKSNTIMAWIIIILVIYSVCNSGIYNGINKGVYMLCIGYEVVGEVGFFDACISE